MRTVRSLRFLLALGVGLMAITAGLAEEATATTTTETSTDAAVVAPEAETTDMAAVETTDTDPVLTVDEAATTEVAPEAEEPAEEVTTVTTTTTEVAVPEEAAATEEASTLDKAVDTATGITETVLENKDTLTTQEVPDAPTVAEVVDTASGVAEAADEVGTGAIANQFSNSQNGGVATAANFAGQIMNSGLVDPNLIKAIAGPASEELGTGLNALKNGAQITAGLTACHNSIQGNEAKIQSSLVSLGTSAVNSDTIQGAGALGSSVIKAWSATSGQEADPMYQLFRIYLDQQGNAGKALTTTQESAYAQLTPQCNDAFASIVETYDDSRGTVSSLMAGGNTNVTCSNYKDNETLVDMTLCVWPSAVWTEEAKIMANITATFTNYGVQLCDISFFVFNLDKAIEKSPVWLPNANTAFPNGIPQGSEIPITASVPWTNHISAGAPIVDIMKGWSACPNGKVAPQPAVKPTPRPTTQVEPISGPSACFVTEACQAAVAPYASDACGAYSQLLSSGCSTCATDVLLGAQASCLKSCAATYCSVPGHTADKGVTSGAGALSRAFAFVATLAAAVAAVLAF